MLNLSNYNKDGSSEAPHLTGPPSGYSWRKKIHEGDKGGEDGMYFDFDYICLSVFLIAHIVTPPPPLRGVGVARLNSVREHVT